MRSRRISIARAGGFGAALVAAVVLTLFVTLTSDPAVASTTTDRARTDDRSASAQSRGAHDAEADAATSVPSPAYCTVPACLIIDPAGATDFTVIVRDFTGNPIAGSVVTLDFDQCLGFNPCHLPPCDGCQWDPVTRVLWTTTDPTGQAAFFISGGGVCGAPYEVRIRADGLLLADLPLASVDQNGDLVVDDADVTLVSEKVGTTDPTAELNCEPPVDNADVQTVQERTGETCAGPGVQDVPPNEQNNDFSCGPAAAASFLMWLREHGFGQLQTRDGKTGIDDFETQLETDSKTDSKTGTQTPQLKDAINGFVDATKHKGQIRAKTHPAKVALEDFGYLDTERSHGEGLLLLFASRDPEIGPIRHFVTVRNITGSGATRTCAYMDPKDGATKEGELSVGPDGKIHLHAEGRDDTLLHITSISPVNTVDSERVNADGEPAENGNFIRYTLYYPTFRPTTDLHIQVWDPRDKYVIRGLPEGWKSEVRKEPDTEERMGSCYIHVWKDGSSVNLPNAGSFTVEYTGRHRIGKIRKAITPTTSGTNDRNDGAQPPVDGHSIAADYPVDPPERPAIAGLGLTDVSPTSMSVALSWDPIPDPDLLQYEVYEMNSGAVLAETTATQLLFENLEPDVAHEFAVAARDTSVMASPRGPSVMAYLDAACAPQIGPGSTQLVHYVPALCSGNDPTPLSFELPGAAAPGRLYVVTLTGSPVMPRDPGPEGWYTRYYHLFADVPLDPGPIQVGIPYDSADVAIDEANIRLLALLDGHWVDVTTGVDPDRNVVSGQLPQLTTIAPWTAGPNDVIDNGSTVDFAFGKIVPNPSTGATRVSFVVSLASRVEVAIFDTQGRRVALLARGPMAPGRHEVLWDGRIGDRAAPAGVYFVRLRSNGVDRSRRVVLTR